MIAQKGDTLINRDALKWPSRLGFRASTDFVSTGKAIREPSAAVPTDLYFPSDFLSFFTKLFLRIADTKVRGEKHRRP
jgi:hypothetical protein